METQPSYPIGHIKRMIQEKLEVPTKELKLVFADQLLEDGCTLSDYNIQDGATIGGVDVHIPLLLYCSLVPSPIQFFNVTVLVLSPTYQLVLHLL